MPLHLDIDPAGAKWKSLALNKLAQMKAFMRAHKLSVLTRWFAPAGGVQLMVNSCLGMDHIHITSDAALWDFYFDATISGDTPETVAGYTLAEALADPYGFEAALGLGPGTFNLIAVILGITVSDVVELFFVAPTLGVLKIATLHDSAHIVARRDSGSSAIAAQASRDRAGSNLLVGGPVTTFSYTLIDPQSASSSVLAAYSTYPITTVSGDSLQGFLKHGNVWAATLREGAGAPANGHHILVVDDTLAIDAPRVTDDNIGYTTRMERLASAVLLSRSVLHNTGSSTRQTVQVYSQNAGLLFANVDEAAATDITILPSYYDKFLHRLDGSAFVELHSVMLGDIGNFPQLVSLSGVNSGVPPTFTLKDGFVFSAWSSVSGGIEDPAVDYEWTFVRFTAQLDDAQQIIGYSEQESALSFVSTGYGELTTNLRINSGVTIDNAAYQFIVHDHKYIADPPFIDYVASMLLLKDDGSVYGPFEWANSRTEAVTAFTSFAFAVGATPAEPYVAVVECEGTGAGMLQRLKIFGRTGLVYTTPDFPLTAGNEDDAVALSMAGETATEVFFLAEWRAGADKFSWLVSTAGTVVDLVAALAAEGITYAVSTPGGNLAFRGDRNELHGVGVATNIFSFTIAADPAFRATEYGAGTNPRFPTATNLLRMQQFEAWASSSPVAP